MVSTTEGLNNNNPMEVYTSGIIKKPSATKQLRQFYDLFYVKQRKSIH